VNRAFIFPILEEIIENIEAGLNSFREVLDNLNVVSK